MKKTKNADTYYQLEHNHYKTLDAVVMERDLTCEVGPSTRYAFSENVQADEGGLRSASLMYTRHMEEWPLFTREVFGTLYDDKDLRPMKDEEKSPFGMKAMETLKSQPSFDMVQSASSAHSLIASESATQLCELVGRAMKLNTMKKSDIETEDPRHSEQKLKDLIDLMREDSEVSQDVIDKLQKRSEQREHKAAKHRNQLMVNMAQQDKTKVIEAGMAEIAKDAEESAKVICMLRGFGMEDSTSDKDEGINSELVKLLKSNKQLLAILELCGRLRSSASKELSKTARTNQCDIAGIVPDNEVSRLVAEELAFLSDQDLSDVALERILESKASCLKLKGQEGKDSGDVVLIVDKSGSMSGVSMIMARALAASIMINALAEDRRVVLCLFDNEPRVVKVPTKNELAGALRMLGTEPSGGTDTKKALSRVVDLGFEELREPDVLLITDGCFSASDAKTAADLYPSETRFFGLFLARGYTAEHKEWMTDTWEILPEEKGKEGALVDIVNTVGRR